MMQNVYKKKKEMTGKALDASDQTGPQHKEPCVVTKIEFSYNSKIKLLSMVG